MIKLIIFDLDGTLVNSSVDITNALNYAIGPYGMPELTVEKTISLVGEGVTRLVEKVLGQERAGIIGEVLERFIAYYSEHLTDYTTPYAGVRETLEELSGYEKAVISNKKEVLSRRLLEEIGLAGHFRAIFGSDSAEEKKPSPKPVLRTLELLSIKPEEAVIVGDSTYDIEAGRAAGIRTIAVTYGYRSAESLREADCLIDDFRDLPRAIDALNHAMSRARRNP